MADMELESTTTNDVVASRVFESFGILESILSFADVSDLLQATLVNRRWKTAGRADTLWKHHTARLWEGKTGFATVKKMFWRTLYSNECVQRMSEQQIRSVFEHPLLADAEKPSQVEKCKTIAELKRMYRVHMLDIMSDISQNHHFYSDVQFGSYASSRVDAKRDSITLLELCNPFGFDMYFKIAREDVDETDQIEFASYEESEDILLYHYGVGYFDESCQFHMKLREEVHSNHHPTDLSWQWIDFGRKLQVGPYPLLTISRTCRWGWKMENIHAILLVRDKAAPEENDI